MKNQNVYTSLTLERTIIVRLNRPAMQMIKGGNGIILSDEPIEVDTDTSSIPCITTKGI